jgi:hypothetical protein
MGATSNIFVADIRYPSPIQPSPIMDKNLSDWRPLFRYRINPTIKKFIPISDSQLSDIKMFELNIAAQNQSCRKIKLIWPYKKVIKKIWQNKQGQKKYREAIPLKKEFLSKISCRISDIAENFNPIWESPTNLLSFSLISEGPIEAHSDIADHGYWTKCPPMHCLKRFE